MPRERRDQAPPQCDWLWPARVFSPERVTEFYICVFALPHFSANTYSEFPRKEEFFVVLLGGKGDKPGQSRLAAQKIEFVFSWQSQNLSTGASGACAPAPSRFNGKTWQASR